MSSSLVHRIPGLEAVAHQDGMLHKTLTSIFSTYIGQDSATIKRSIGSKVKRVVKEATGIDTTTRLDETPVINAYVMIKFFDINHALIPDGIGALIPEKEVKKFVKDKGKDNVAYLDLERSFFTGLFSDIPFEIYLCQGLFNGRLSAAEISAIFIHELGHCASFLEHMGTQAHTNRVLAQVSQELSQDIPLQQKYRILDGVGITLDNDTRESLVKKRDKDTIVVTLYREYLGEQRRLLGKQSYDNTTFEMMADQFTVRHKAGKDQVSALDKMTSHFTDVSGSLPGFLTMQIIQLTFLTAILFLGPIGWLISILVVMGIMGEDRYDKLEARFQRIYNDMVDALKKGDLKPDDTRQILDDLTVVKERMSRWNDRRGVIEWVASTLIPKYRRRHTQLEFQQELEKLARSELYVKAAQFQTL